MNFFLPIRKLNGVVTIGLDLLYSAILKIALLHSIRVKIFDCTIRKCDLLTSIRIMLLYLITNNKTQYNKLSLKYLNTLGSGTFPIHQEMQCELYLIPHSNKSIGNVFINMLYLHTRLLKLNTTVLSGLICLLSPLKKYILTDPSVLTIFLVPLGNVMT